MIDKMTSTICSEDSQHTMPGFDATEYVPFGLLTHCKGIRSDRVILMKSTNRIVPFRLHSESRETGDRRNFEQTNPISSVASRKG